VVAMKTGPLGTLSIWLPSRLGRSCRRKRHCDPLEEVQRLHTRGIMSTANPCSSTNQSAVCSVPSLSPYEKKQMASCSQPILRHASLRKG